MHRRKVNEICNGRKWIRWERGRFLQGRKKKREEQMEMCMLFLKEQHSAVVLALRELSNEDRNLGGNWGRRTCGAKNYRSGRSNRVEDNIRTNWEQATYLSKKFRRFFVVTLRCTTDWKKTYCDPMLKCWRRGSFAVPDRRSRPMWTYLIPWISWLLRTVWTGTIM